MRDIYVTCDCDYDCGLVKNYQPYEVIETSVTGMDSPFCETNTPDIWCDACLKYLDVDEFSYSYDR